MRKITLCADDYALSPAVSKAIRQLLAQKRLNATSVMTGSPEIADEAKALLAVQGAFQIGLHLTLTKSFENGPTINQLIVKSIFNLQDSLALKRDIESQYNAFIAHFGRAPDFVDGHQHCHILPQIRGVLLEVLRENQFKGWIRQTNGAGVGGKAWVISFLSRGFAKAAHDFTLNHRFSGSYHFTPHTDYAMLFPQFLYADLIMCHPGQVDETLKKRDNLLAEREREFAYFQSEAFLNALKAANVVL